MSKMLVKAATKTWGMCGCAKHHRPRRAWSKSERHQARAVEKRQWRKDRI